MNISEFNVLISVSEELDKEVSNAVVKSLEDGGMGLPLTSKMSHLLLILAKEVKELSETVRLL